MTPISLIHWLLTTGTLTLIIVLILSFAIYLTSLISKPIRKHTAPFFDIFARYRIELLFALTFGSMLGSLFYSEVMHLPPCDLCWWGRICMYPMAIIAGVALLKNRTDVTTYLYPFVFFGIALSLYHVGLQEGWIPAFLCSAKNGVACSEPPFVAYGFITIPLMGLTAYITLLGLLRIKK